MTATTKKEQFSKTHCKIFHHFYRIKITTTRNAQPNEVVSSRTVNSFKNSLDKHWQKMFVQAGDISKKTVVSPPLVKSITNVKVCNNVYKSKFTLNFKATQTSCRCRRIAVKFGHLASTVPMSLYVHNVRAFCTNVYDSVHNNIYELYTNIS